MKNIMKISFSFIVIFFFVSACGSSGDNSANNDNNGNNATVITPGIFSESFETSNLGTLKPTDSLTPFAADEGAWYIDATVDGEPEPEGCGPTPHLIEIFNNSGSKSLKMTSNNSYSGCCDNVWIWWDIEWSGNADKVPIAPYTKISFKETGDISGTECGGWNNYDCGTFLAVVDNRDNVVFYRLQWPDGATESGSEGHMKYLLPETAGSYERDLFLDFTNIPNFEAEGAYITGFVFEIDPMDSAAYELGWAIIDDIRVEVEAP